MEPPERAEYWTWNKVLFPQGQACCVNAIPPEVMYSDLHQILNNLEGGLGCKELHHSSNTEITPVHDRLQESLASVLLSVEVPQYTARQQ